MDSHKLYLALSFLGEQFHVTVTTISIAQYDNDYTNRDTRSALSLMMFKQQVFACKYDNKMYQTYSLLSQYYSNGSYINNYG